MDDRTRVALTPDPIDAAVARHAATRPEREAVRCGEETLTYAQLLVEADRLALRLQRTGVKNGALVGICVDRSVQMVVGLVGILRAGAAYLPLDPALPPERLAFLLADSGARTVVTQRRHLAHLPNVGLAVELLDDDQDEDDGDDETGGSAAAITNRSTPDSLAYVTYTSGSTGSPKGVLVTHANVVNLVRDQDYVRVVPEDRVAALATLAFDASTFELWAPLVNGATCVVYDFTDADLPRLVEDVRRDEVTVLHLTSPVFRLLAPRHYAALSGVRCLLFGGDASRTEHGAAAAASFAGDLVHLYGPTETTGFATYQDVRRCAPGTVNVPIGRPLRNVEVFVLDEAGVPVEPGDQGELFIGGAGVSRGYLGRPDLTRERFVPSPVDGHATVYRTGDLVRTLDDGALQFLGRADRQIKVRGFRIEPAEIEQALVRHEGVQDAVVVAWEDARGDKVLHAYVVPSAANVTGLSTIGAPAAADGPAAEALVSSLRAHIARHLAKHQAPSFISVIDAVPLTSNLKVDEARLPRRLPAGGAAGFVPTGETDTVAVDAPEHLLRQAWSAALGSTGAPDADFFEAGGDSLSAVQMLLAVEDLTGCRVGIGDFFEEPTLQGLLRLTSQRQDA